MKKLPLAFAIIAAFSVPSFAADSAFDAFMGRVVGNQTTVSFGGGGTPLATSSAHLGTPSVGNMGVGGGASGPSLQGRANVPIGGGKSLPVDVKAAFTKQQFGRILAGAARIANPIGAVIAIGSFGAYLAELGYSNFRNTPEGITAEIQDPTTTYFYYFSSFGPYSSGSAACGKIASLQTNAGISVPPDYSMTFDGNSHCVRHDGVTYSLSKSPNPAVTVVTHDQNAIADNIALQSGWPTSATQLLQEALKTPGISPQVQTETPTVTGPSAIPGEKAVTTETIRVKPGTNTQAAPGEASEPATKTTTKTQTTNVTYNDNKVTTNTTTNTSTSITNNVTNITTIEGDSTTTTTNEDGVTQEAPKEEILTCGLPGKPPCKIDEAGTPEAKQDTAEADAKKAIKPLDDFIANPTSALPTFPTINWAFTLPSGCAPIALPAFEPWLQQIDVCAFQPMFHDLMSFVWVMGGIFGAIGTFWRNTFSQG